MSGEIKDWIAKEFETLEFNSKRLETRFKTVLNDLSDQPDKSIWLATGSRTNAKAAYRLIANKKCTKQNILSAHINATTNRSKTQNILLAVQDTTAINYTGHKKNRRIRIQLRTKPRHKRPHMPLTHTARHTLRHTRPNNHNTTRTQKQQRQNPQPKTKTSHRRKRKQPMAKNNANRQKQRPKTRPTNTHN